MLFSNDRLFSANFGWLPLNLFYFLYNVQLHNYFLSRNSYTIFHVWIFQYLIIKSLSPVLQNGLIFKNRCDTNFISSIWEDDGIERLENIKWKCLWCGMTFQGTNDTTALAHVLGTRGMYINSCHDDIDKYHLSRYKYLHNYKAARKSVINDHFHKDNYSFERIQEKSSEVTENTLNQNYGSRYVSNLSTTPETSSFITGSSMSANSNPMKNQ